MEGSDLRNKLSNGNSDILETTDLRSRLSTKRASEPAPYWDRSLDDITLTVGGNENQIGRRFEHVEELEYEDPGLPVIKDRIPVDLREKIHTSNGPPIRLAVGGISETQIGRRFVHVEELEYEDQGLPLINDGVDLREKIQTNDGGLHIDIDERKVILQNEPRGIRRPPPPRFRNNYYRSKDNTRRDYEPVRYHANMEEGMEDYYVDDDHYQGEQRHFEERRLYFDENRGYTSSEITSYPPERRPIYSAEELGYSEERPRPMYPPERISYLDPYDSNERYSSKRFVYEETERPIPDASRYSNLPPYQNDLRRDLDSRRYDQQETKEQFQRFGVAPVRDPYESIQERSDYHRDHEHLEGASGVYDEDDDGNSRQYHDDGRRFVLPHHLQNENQHFQTPPSPQYDDDLSHQQNYNSYGGEQEKYLDYENTENYGYHSRASQEYDVTAAAENTGYVEKNTGAPPRNFEQVKANDFMKNNKIQQQFNQTRQGRNRSRRQRKLEIKRSQNLFRKGQSTLHVEPSTSVNYQERPTAGPDLLPLETNNCNRSNDEAFLSDPDPPTVEDVSVSSSFFIRPSGPSANRVDMGLPMLLSGEDPFNPVEDNEPRQKNMTTNNAARTKNQMDRQKKSQGRVNNYSSGTSFKDFMNGKDQRELGKTRDDHIEIIKEIRKNTTTVARSRSPKDDPKKIKSSRRRSPLPPQNNNNRERSRSPNQIRRSPKHDRPNQRAVEKALDIVRNLSPPSPPRSPSPMIKQNALAADDDEQRTSRSPGSYFRNKEIRESPRRYRKRSPERRESPPDISKRFAPLPLNLESNKNRDIYTLSPRTERYSKIREKQQSRPELTPSPPSPPRMDLSPPPLNIPKRMESKIDNRYKIGRHHDSPTNERTSSALDYVNNSKRFSMYDEERDDNPRSSSTTVKESNHMKCSNCKGIGHQSSVCPRIECKNCQRLGHMAYLCQEPPTVICRNCNIKGHVIQDCPYRENNKTSSSSSFSKQPLKTNSNSDVVDKVSIDYHHLKDSNEVSEVFSKPKGSLLGFISEKILAKSQPLTKADEMMHTWRLAGHNEESLMNKIKVWHPPNRTKLRIHLMDELNKANPASMSLNIKLSELLDLTVDFFMPTDRINLLEGRLTNASREFERMLETSQQMASSSIKNTSSSTSAFRQDHSDHQSQKMEQSLKKLNQLSSMLDLQIGPPNSEDRRSYEVRINSFNPLRDYIMERMRKDAGKFGITEAYIQKSSQAIVKVLAAAKFSIPLMRHHLSSYGIKSLADLISSKISMYEPNFPGGISSNYIVRLTLDYIEEFHH